MHIIMDKVNNVTQQNKPINYVIKIKRELYIAIILDRKK